MRVVHANTDMWLLEWLFTCAKVILTLIISAKALPDQEDTSDDQPDTNHLIIVFE